MSKVAKSILTRIKKHFPAVTSVVDAIEPVFVEVLPEDGRVGRKKDPEHCAFARACMRKHLADGCIIGIAYSYLIKGSTAVRYMTPGTVGREITSFDRHQDFAEGQNYRLSAVSPSMRMGEKRKRKRGVKNGSRADVDSRRRHHTTRIRVSGA